MNLVKKPRETSKTFGFIHMKPGLKSQADRYYNLLLDEIEFVAEKPQSGKDHGHIRGGYFRTRVKSHYIFYRINLRKNQIEIIRILHQRMDIEARLND